MQRYEVIALDIGGRAGGCALCGWFRPREKQPPVQLRECYGYPIYINSGYRCKELNDLVGGVANSFHLSGCAADLDTRRGREENQRIYNFIRDNLPFTEMGWEGGGQWVHVALVPGRENEKELF